MMTEGRDWDAAVMSANIAVQCVWRSIEGLGLKVSSHKTEALFLHNVAWEGGGRGGCRIGCVESSDIAFHPLVLDAIYKIVRVGVYDFAFVSLHPRVARSSPPRIVCAQR